MSAVPAAAKRGSHGEYALSRRTRAKLIRELHARALAGDVPSIEALIRLGATLLGHDVLRAAKKGPPPPKSEGSR
jgi:hypothetical protein